MFTLRFDMRAPGWAGPAADLYAAAIDMCAWAETWGAVLAEWPASEFDATYRVDIEGDPDIHRAMTLGAAEGRGAGHAAMAATAMRVVNAIPYVVDAPPGLLNSLDIPTTLPRHAFD